MITTLASVAGYHFKLHSIARNGHELHECSLEVVNARHAYRTINCCYLHNNIMMISVSHDHSDDISTDT